MRALFSDQVNVFQDDGGGLQQPRHFARLFQHAHAVPGEQDDGAVGHLVRQVHGGESFASSRRAIEQEAAFDMAPHRFEFLALPREIDGLPLDTLQHALRQDDTIALNGGQPVKANIERAMLATSQ